MPHDLAEQLRTALAEAEEQEKLVAELKVQLDELRRPIQAILKRSRTCRCCAGEFLAVQPCTILNSSEMQERRGESAVETPQSSVGQSSAEAYEQHRDKLGEAVSPVWPDPLPESVRQALLQQEFGHGLARVLVANRAQIACETALVEFTAVFERLRAALIAEQAYPEMLAAVFSTFVELKQALVRHGFRAARQDFVPVWPKPTPQS